MKRPAIISAVIAVLIFIGLSTIATMGQADASLIGRIAPLESADAIGFSLAFGSDLPELVARTLGFLVIFGIPIAVFFGLQAIFRRGSAA
ncbi:hypothetical protein [Ruegeria sp. HKCCD8929]|uniref:hypothetical protein n=1 Tax=Ruegeria sp. HKCCD8929 TaxID=2683006 RepID=UPI00148857B2|nr:hypothetical protein [Ruegeria sp. HKCCD8929]